MMKKNQQQQPRNDYSQPSSSAGTPRMPDRNFRRQAAFNEEKAGKEWGAIMLNADRQEEALKTAKPRPPRYRKFKEKPKKAEGPVKSETPSAPSNTIDYEGRATGGKAVTYVNSQNFSYTAFPTLVREMYTLMATNETTLSRALPFCIFQHYLAVILNATIIKRSIVCNVEQRFINEVDPFEVINADTLWIPSPFLDYINGIGPSLTASGDKVFVNLPSQGVPRPPLRLEEEEVDIPSGSFGTCDAANHNAYEEYVCPLVTSKLVERTREAFNDHNYGHWEPILP